MKKNLVLAATLLLINSHQVLAGSVRTVYSQDVDSNFLELKICQGYGLTINLMSTGEVIKQVWIGDPSRFAFTSNGNLCQKSNDNSNDPNCSQGNATVLFLRQITPIKFANLTSSSDGNTQITIITSGSDGQKQYQFKLIPATGSPSYTSLVIKPDSARPLPVVPVAIKPEVAPTNLDKIPAPATINSILPGRTLPRNDANALVYGLAIAHSNGQIKEGSITWKKAQDAVKLLRQGKSKEEAISRSGVKEEVFNQLIQWGQK
ncbi:hypothetical protein GNF10_31025 [Nostoc sp. UCD121]|uniref:hypothetical protein n=1 Tax=unclassified Nostoc TaxID=2593658 RepID=UPI001624CDA1|nr:MULTISPECIES: hypothetical protein [unclassified Nostoc]MBC1222695.1 hypothetical protein [Nostoc sp. UCD120]MBC1280262.1 hypothetical protein [Nostoc sp. UCD121]